MAKIHPPTKHDITDQAHLFTKRSDIKVTTDAVELATEILRRVIEDPHQLWVASTDVRLTFVWGVVPQLPDHFAICAGRRDLIKSDVKSLFPGWDREMRRLMPFADDLIVYPFGFFAPRRQLSRIGYFELLHYIAGNIAFLNPFPRKQIQSK